MQLINNVIGSTNNLSSYLQNNSPKILSVSGMALGAGACVASGVGTWKARDILEQHNIDIDDLHEDLNATNTPEEREEIEKEIRKRYLLTGLLLGAAYAPAASMMTGSIICGIASQQKYENKIKNLEGNLATLGVTALLLKKAYDDAKERVAEKYGEEEANDIFYGSHEEEVECVNEKGKTKKVKKKVYEPYGIVASNPCSFLIGDGVDSALSGMSYGDIIRRVKDIEEYWTYRVIAGDDVRVWQIYTDKFNGFGMKIPNKYLEDIYMSNGWFKDIEAINRYKNYCAEQGIIITQDDINRKFCTVSFGLENMINERFMAGAEPMAWMLPNCNSDILMHLYEDFNAQKTKYAD